MISFNREQNAPATDPALDAEAKARRSQAESERVQRYYVHRASGQLAACNPIPAELQAQIDQIMAENEVGFTGKLLKLMKRQKMAH